MRASAEARARLDDLDVSRRVDAVFPQVAREIDAALLQPVPACARALLAVAGRLVPDLIPAGVPGALDRILTRAEQAARTGE
jgi:hypothetical protein